jgi:hypothetical protein
VSIGQTPNVGHNFQAMPILGDSRFEGRLFSLCPASLLCSLGCLGFSHSAGIGLDRQNASIAI